MSSMTASRRLRRSVPERAVRLPVAGTERSHPARQRHLSAVDRLSAEDLYGRKLQDLLNIAGRIYFETHFAPLLRMQGFFNEVALEFTRKMDGVFLSS